MTETGTYIEYARCAVKDFTAFDEARRNALVDALETSKTEKVLDVGCGPGQQLLPFAEKKNSFCVGIDIATEVGQVGKQFFAEAGQTGKAEFLSALGEELPFADESFDVVICRVALPYMDNRRALAEISRVLKPNGFFFLKTHAPPFYFGMIKRRLPELNPKGLAYPLICLACGTISLLAGKHPRGKFWRGKEVYQTGKFLKRELAKNDLKIVRELADTNAETPSFLIEKI